MYKVDTDSRWRINCSGPNFTEIISAVLKSRVEMHTWSNMYARWYARAGRPVDLPQSAVTLGEVQNGVYKGSAVEDQG